MRAKRFLTVFLAMCLLTVSLAVLPTQAKESPARQIALVYDDSGSMIFNDADEYQENWYRAKYAMEVFAAMMGEKDTMTVFPMSFYRTSVEGSSAPITLRGEQTAEERVKTLHEMNHDYLGTPFNSVRAACSFLQQADSGSEKWLVVLTDGAFEGVPGEGTEGFLRQQAAQGGFKVIYMAMGSAAVSINSDPAAGLYSYPAATSGDILSSVTQVANQVFSRRALPAEQIVSGEDSLTIRLDVPVSELILFVQGEEVEVGSIQDAAGMNSWSASTKTRVKYSDQLPPNYSDEAHRGKATFDNSLQGLLADFVPEQPMPTGEYTIKVSNASQAEIYYTPYVEVGVRLTDAFGNQWELKGDTSSLYSGNYTAEAYLVDPITGEQLESGLVHLESAQVQMENNGNAVTLEGLENGTAQLFLERGGIKGSVTAELDGYQTLTSEFDAAVDPALWQANLEYALPEAKEGYEYEVDRLDEGGAIQITVWEIDPETGQKQPMQQADWENAQVTATTAQVQSPDLSLWKKMLYGLHGLLFSGGEKTMEWTVTPGTEVSTYLVYPQADENSKSAVWGDVQIQLDLDSKGQNHSSAAQLLFGVRIAPPSLADTIRELFPFFISSLVLLLVLIFWLRKKRLPRGLSAEVHIHTFGVGKFSGGDQVIPVPIRRKFSLFRPEIATMNPSVPGTLTVAPLRLCAQVRTMQNGKRRFCITNLDKLVQNRSIHPVQLNGVAVVEGDEKKLQKGNCTLRCTANSDHKAGNHATCTLNFFIDKRKKGLFGKRKKNKRHHNRHRRH